MKFTPGFIEKLRYAGTSVWLNPTESPLEVGIRFSFAFEETDYRKEGADFELTVSQPNLLHSEPRKESESHGLYNFFGAGFFIINKRHILAEEKETGDLSREDWDDLIAFAMQSLIQFGHAGNIVLEVPDARFNPSLFNGAFACAFVATYPVLEQNFRMHLSMKRLEIKAAELYLADLDADKATPDSSKHNLH